MKLIDKDAVVAEVEKTYNFHEKRGNIHDASICDVLYGLLHRINAIEVEDVDLDEYIDDFFSIEYRCVEYETIWINEKDWRDSIKRCAKEFFELGLKAQKRE